MLTISATAKCPKCGADMVPLFYWSTVESLFWKCANPDCNHKVTKTPRNLTKDE